MKKTEEEEQEEGEGRKGGRKEGRRRRRKRRRSVFAVLQPYPGHPAEVEDLQLPLAELPDSVVHVEVDGANGAVQVERVGLHQRYL